MFTYNYGCLLVYGALLRCIRDSSAVTYEVPGLRCEVPYVSRVSRVSGSLVWLVVFSVINGG